MNQPSPPPVVEQRILVDRPDLRIGHFPGDNDIAVVAFTGIGHGMGAIQREEFTGTAMGADRNHVISVIDRDRSWYSAPGIQARIADTLRGLWSELGLRRMICLGNSMGGHGALLFAERVGADTAIGFVPQYTLHSRFGEPRWANFRDAMHDDRMGRLAPHLTGKTRAYAIFGADDVQDRRHVAAIAENCIARLHLVAGTDHNTVTPFLKEQKLLGPLITAMIDNDDAEVTRLLAPFSSNPGQGPQH